jgi:hypothetical protein
MFAGARRFVFVAGRYEGVEPAIGCDGLVPGAALDLTHWQGNHTPPELKADTSTEIALRFIARPESERWNGAVVVNNHFDTDGLLSVWVLLNPAAAPAHSGLLVAAAEAGDFDEWPANERGLWLDASIRALAAGQADDASAYDLTLDVLPELLRDLEGRRDLWGPEWDLLQAAEQSVHEGALRIRRLGTLGLVVHGTGQSECPGPLLARQFLPVARRYLLAFDQGDDQFLYRYERPRYTWAETVVRPRCHAPHTEALLQSLGPPWTTDDLPGLTGIVQTRTPIDTPPDQMATRLRSLDPC